MFLVNHRIVDAGEVSLSEASDPMEVAVIVKPPRPTNIQKGIVKGYSPEQYRAWFAQGKKDNGGE